MIKAVSLERLECYTSGSIRFGPFTYAPGSMHHPATAAAYLNEITESEEILIHGSGNAPSKTVALFPQQAFDASSVFGNLNALYATTSGTEALFRAIYNKPFARYIAAIAGDIEIAGFTHLSQKGHQEVYEFRFMPFIFELLQSGFPNMLRDGFIYALPRDAGFERHPERPKEWYAHQWVKPLTHFEVKHQELGDFYLRNKRLRYHSRPYTGEEIERFRGIAAANDRLPELESPEFDKLRELIPPPVIRWVLEDQTTAYSQI